MEKNKKVIIGLVGETGSGKDTVAKYLEEKYNANLMRFADPLKDTLKIYFDEISKTDQAWLALEFRKRFGNDILGKALRKKIENGEGVISINGLRMPEDYEFVKSFENSFIVYITAEQELRWKRSVIRGEKSDDSLDLAHFQEIERGETEIHIPQIGAKADFTIRNEKDLEHLLSETDRIMANIR